MKISYFIVLFAVDRSICFIG